MREGIMAGAPMFVVFCKRCGAPVRDFTVTRDERARGYVIEAKHHNDSDTLALSDDALFGVSGRAPVTVALFRDRGDAS